MLKYLLDTVRRRFDERKAYRQAFRELELLHLGDVDGLLAVEAYEHRSTIRR